MTPIAEVIRKLMARTSVIAPGKSTRLIFALKFAFSFFGSLREKKTEMNAANVAGTCIRKDLDRHECYVVDSTANQAHHRHPMPSARKPPIGAPIDWQVA